MPSATSARSAERQLAEAQASARRSGAASHATVGDLVLCTGRILALAQASPDEGVRTRPGEAALSPDEGSGADALTASSCVEEPERKLAERAGRELDREPVSAWRLIPGSGCRES